MICEKFGTWKPVREIPELEGLWEWAPPAPPQPGWTPPPVPAPNHEAAPVNEMEHSDSGVTSRRPLIPASFGLAVLCFLFAFCDFKCGGQHIASVTGIQFVTGMKMEGMDFGEFGQTGSNQAPPNIWAIAALFTAIVGCGVYLASKRTESAAGVLLGVLGAAAMLALQASVKTEFEKQGEGALIAEFQPAYWISLLAMIAAAIISGTLPSGSRQLKVATAQPPPMPTPPVEEASTNEAQFDELLNEDSEIADESTYAPDEADELPDQTKPSQKDVSRKAMFIGVTLGILVLAVSGYFSVVKPNADILGDSASETLLTDGANFSEAQAVAPHFSQDVTPLPGSIVAQKNLNVREAASVDGAKLGLLKQLEEVKILERGRKDVVEGIEDYWYKVAYKNKSGYVFGHYTNLKLQGQKTVVLPFEGCAFGDLFHLTFGSRGNNSGDYLDFGQGMNNYSGFELCLENSEGENYPNPKYLGKNFKVTYNDLFAKTYCNAPVNYDICIQPVKTIVRLELVNLGGQTASTANRSAIFDPDFISQPIENLFSAWRQLDLQLYMDQWDRNAIQYSKKFSPRNYEDILSRRSALFGKLSRVEVGKYDISDWKQEADGRASLRVKYSMVFYFTNGKSITESDVTEKYVLNYNDQNNRWMILNNYDYID